MKLGDVTLSDDKKTMTFMGRNKIYTLEVGKTYPPKSKRVEEAGAQSSVTIVGFIEPTAYSDWMAILNYSGTSGAHKRMRQTSGTRIRAIVACYEIPYVPARHLYKKRYSQEEAATNLDAKLVAQLVADVAELRARVHALEGGQK